ncbi:unnamed protein product [Merluccius merluccius]
MDKDRGFNFKLLVPPRLARGQVSAVRPQEVVEDSGLVKHILQQFENEGLSIKLEEQINENEDLRNKNNATRNLCNLLKDTFERSAEKIHLFESEREETHHLFLENSESIQGMITAFEKLRVQAEADQHEMLKVKEGMLQFEELKEKVQQEYIIKYNEVEILKTKLEEKKEELEKLLLKLHKTQESCKQLQEENGKHSELLKSSKYEQDSLLQKLEHAEKLCEETESNLASITSALEQNKEEYQQLNQKKDLKIEELSKVKDQQAKTLVEMQAVANERESSLTSEMERGKELELKLESIIYSWHLRFLLCFGLCSQKNTSKSLDFLWERNKCIEAKVQEITAELSRANEEAKLYKIKVEIVSA